MRSHSASAQEFFLACVYGQIDIAESYIAENKGNPSAFNNGDAFFIVAAAKGHTTIVAALLKVPGILVDERCYSLHTPLLAAVINGREDIVRLLTQDGRADLNFVGLEGCTPMSVAIKAGNKTMVTLLLEAGARIPKLKQNKMDKDIEDLLFSWHMKTTPTHKVGMLLQPYLAEDTQLTLRSTCRDFRDAMQQCQQGPWRTKKQYAMAITGNFSLGIKDMLQMSWNCYNTIMRDIDDQPAIIHSIRDHSLNIYSADERNIMKESGRIYNPEHTHTLESNAIWTIANIHKGRAFQIISPLTEVNMKRNDNNRASAFAIEIAGVMQAKYTLTMEGDSWLLNPSDQATRRQVKLRNVKFSDNQVTMFTRKAIELKDKAFVDGETMTKKIKTLTLNNQL